MEEDFLPDWAVYGPSEEVDEPEEEFDEPSYMHVPDCTLGHCGCYYTNCNRCCRCHKNQHDRPLIDRSDIPWERPHKKNYKLASVEPVGVMLAPNQWRN